MPFGGQPEYIFQTQEWAEMCAKHLNSLDTAFGRGPATMRLSTTGNIGIGTSHQPSNWMCVDQSLSRLCRSPMVAKSRTSTCLRSLESGGAAQPSTALGENLCGGRKHDTRRTKPRHARSPSWTAKTVGWADVC